MNYTITNSWGDITLVCCNRHATMVPMQIESHGASPFYACPKYKDHALNERACNNRLSLADYTAMLQHLHNIIVENELHDRCVNLTNYTWRDRKGTIYRVMSHEGNKMVISVLNKRAINS